MLVFMGMAKAVYVRDDDVELWERAEAYAKARRLTMSALVLTALVEIYDPATETFAPALADGRVLIAGGYDPSIQPTPRSWLFQSNRVSSAMR